MEIGYSVGGKVDCIVSLFVQQRGGSLLAHFFASLAKFAHAVTLVNTPVSYYVDSFHAIALTLPTMCEQP